MLASSLAACAREAVEPATLVLRGGTFITMEETGLQVQVTRLLDVYPRGGPTEGADILIVYAAQVTGGTLQPGDDAAQAAYFAPSTLPELAFTSTQKIIERWLAVSADPRADR